LKSTARVPTRIDVTPNDGGEHDERAVLERTIERDRLYVMDRGDAKFALFNKIVKAKSSYVCRLRAPRLSRGRYRQRSFRCYLPKGGRLRSSTDFSSTCWVVGAC
jgi:hypothetical protein